MVLSCYYDEHLRDSISVFCCCVPQVMYEAWHRFGAVRQSSVPEVKTAGHPAALPRAMWYLMPGSMKMRPVSDKLFELHKENRLHMSEVYTTP